MIDGFIADRIAATTAAWRRNEGSRIEEHPLRFSSDIHFMLSRATQRAQSLARLNDAIDQLKRSGDYSRIADSYALPVLINQTLDTDWLRIDGVRRAPWLSPSPAWCLPMRAATRCLEP